MGDGSMAFACPGADPLGLRRLRTADFDYFDESDIKNNAVVALPPVPASIRSVRKPYGSDGTPAGPPCPPRRRPLRWHW